MIEPGAGEIVKFVEIKILKEEVMVVDEVAERRRVTTVKEREQRFAAARTWTRAWGRVNYRRRGV